MRREERVTVQGPVKEQQPDGMSHRGRGGLTSSLSDAPQPAPNAHHCGHGARPSSRPRRSWRITCGIWTRTTRRTKSIWRTRPIRVSCSRPSRRWRTRQRWGVHTAGTWPRARGSVPRGAGLSPSSSLPVRIGEEGKLRAGCTADRVGCWSQRTRLVSGIPHKKSGERRRADPVQISQQFHISSGEQAPQRTISEMI